MRRSARVLSAAALAGSAVGFMAAPASAEPSAEITPHSAVPGGAVTVTVSCAMSGGAPPDFIEATSQGFEDGRVRLYRVDGDAIRARDSSSVLYSGVARIPDGGAVGDIAALAGRDAEWGVDGRCPVRPGGRVKPWSASFSVSRDRTEGRRGEEQGTLPGSRQAEGQARTQGSQKAMTEPQAPGGQQGYGQLQQGGTGQGEGRVQQPGTQLGDGSPQQPGDGSVQQPGGQQGYGQLQQGGT
ncbi:hypothetical protein ABZ904_15535, partial [Streptomyces sp. NPDC046900]|uniref:hypothetical protein n=1 Tax=Streptomyces sp. NPDC046900 TaxID=3155473 RepID=UPI0034016918